MKLQRAVEIRLVGAVCTPGAMWVNGGFMIKGCVLARARYVAYAALPTHECVAQEAEQLPFKQWVEGSNPSTFTIKSFLSVCRLFYIQTFSTLIHKYNITNLIERIDD